MDAWESYIFLSPGNENWQEAKGCLNRALRGSQLSFFLPSPFLTSLTVTFPQAFNRPSGKKGRCFNLTFYRSGGAPRIGAPASLSCNASPVPVDSCVYKAFKVTTKKLSLATFLSVIFLHVVVIFPLSSFLLVIHLGQDGTTLIICVFFLVFVCVCVCFFLGCMCYN